MTDTITKQEPKLSAETRYRQSVAMVRRGAAMYFGAALVGIVSGAGHPLWYAGMVCMMFGLFWAVAGLIGAALACSSAPDDGGDA